jgi:hypothetical protein
LPRPYVNILAPCILLVSCGPCSCSAVQHDRSIIRSQFYPIHSVSSVSLVLVPDEHCNIPIHMPANPGACGLRIQPLSCSASPRSYSCSLFLILAFQYASCTRLCGRPSPIGLPSLEPSYLSSPEAAFPLALPLQSMPKLSKETLFLIPLT